MQIKKQLPKPAYWQDFEDLCKILWGEIWGIPDKIKKNGRLGDEQNGIDIIGRPSGKQNYSGIQCKGKDDYTDKKLTKKEIDREIANALSFTPELEVFIFATTSNKNSEIEKYVYQKDHENRANGKFEILLYCWEDIVDLMEKHTVVYNHYMQYVKSDARFDFEMCFSDGSHEATIKPRFCRRVTETVLRTKQNQAAEGIMNGDFIKKLHGNTEPNVNHSWDGVEIEFENTGNKVIEDYHINIWVDENAVRQMKGYLGGVLETIQHSKYSSLHVFDDCLEAVYEPRDKKPLIQKTGRRFNIYFLANHKEYSFQLHYHLKARDWDKEGTLTIHVKPEYEKSRVLKLVDNNAEANKSFEQITDIMSYGSAFG